MVRPGSNPSLAMLGETYHKPVVKSNKYVPIDLTDARKDAGKFITNLNDKSNVASGMQVTEDMMKPIKYVPKKRAVPVHAYDRDYSNYTGWAGKKGGRVTGIAKRGFGRALMKGKK